MEARSSVPVGKVVGMTPDSVERVRWRAAWQPIVAMCVVAVMVLVAFFAVLVAIPKPAAAQGPTFRSVRIGVGDDSLQIATQNPLRITLLYEYVLVFNVYSTLLTY